MVFGILIAKNQGIPSRHFGRYTKNHNSMERMVGIEYNNQMDNEEVKQTTLNMRIP